MNHNCPVCDMTDSVQKVSTVMDTETEQSIGGAISLTGSGGIAGMVPSVLATSSRSSLVQRLTPRKVTPGNISYGAFVTSIWVTSTAIAIYFKRIWMPGLPGENILSAGFEVFLCWLPALAVSCVVLFIVFTIYRFANPSGRRRWINSAAYVRSCYYCFRDDVVFDGVNWGTPEDFGAFIFANNKKLTVTH